MVTLLDKDHSCSEHCFSLLFILLSASTSTVIPAVFLYPFLSIPTNSVLDGCSIMACLTSHFNGYDYVYVTPTLFCNSNCFHPITQVYRLQTNQQTQFCHQCWHTDACFSSLSSQWEESVCLLPLCMRSGIPFCFLIDRLLINETGTIVCPVKKENKYIYKQLKAKVEKKEMETKSQTWQFSFPSKWINRM